MENIKLGEEIKWNLQGRFGETSIISSICYMCVNANTVLTLHSEVFDRSFLSYTPFIPLTHVSMKGSTWVI